MSVPEDLPEMDGADLLGLLFHSGEDGSTEPLFPDGSGLIESWLSEQDVRHRNKRLHLITQRSNLGLLLLKMCFFGV